MFNQNTNGYSLADIAAVNGNNNEFLGNGSGWWIIILFLIWGNTGMFNGYGYGYNRPNECGHTNSGITDGYILTSDFANIERKIDTVNNGLCDGFYAMNTGMLNGFNNLNTSLLNGFAGINHNITQQTIDQMQNTNALTAQINGVSTQMQANHCENDRLIESRFADLNYNLATLACQTRQSVADAARELKENNNNGVREILKYLTEDKIATLQSENQSLKFAASQADQNAYLIKALSPNPIPAYTVPNPYAPYINAGGYGCGCGANI